eukprot:506869-Alexandrium_andersonii.AAC.1
MQRHRPSRNRPKLPEEAPWALLGLQWSAFGSLAPPVPLRAERASDRHRSEHQHWHLYIAGCPKCNPQSAQAPSGLQSASIRNPPC